MNENMKVEVVVTDAGAADRVLRWAQSAGLVNGLTIRVESHANGNGASSEMADWLSSTFAYSDAPSSEEAVESLRYTVIKGL